MEGSENNEKLGVFKKVVPAQKFQSELEMSDAAQQIGLNCNLFSVPKIYSKDNSKSSIEFELITNFYTFRHYYIQETSFGKISNTINTLFYRIGQGLYKVHSEKALFENVKKENLPEDYNTESKIGLNSRTYIHGDFTLSNIFYVENDDQIIFTDWSSSPRFENSFNYGSRYWDLTFFISSLYFCSFSTYFGYSLREKLCRAFIEGYLVESDLDRDAFYTELKDYLSKKNYYNLREYNSHFEELKKKGLNGLLLKRSLAQLNRLINKL